MNNIVFNEERLKSIDYFRGLIIILMVIVNFLKVLDWIPAFLKHATPGNVTFVDIIAPAFIFIVGLTFPLSYKKRVRQSGKRATIEHTISRGLSLIGIEVLFYLYVQLIYTYRETVVWNTLSIIGFTIIISLPFINARSWVKVSVGTLLIVFHQLVPLSKYGFKLYLIGGGAYSLAGWSSIMFFSLFMSDLLFKNRERPKWKLFIISGVIFTILGVFSSFYIPYVRDGMSLSLCFLSVGITSLAFYCIHYFSKKVNLKLNIITAWGRNPLILYLLSIAFIPFNIVNKNLYIFSEPNWILVLYFLGYMGFLQLCVTLLSKRNIIIKF